MRFTITNSQIYHFWNLFRIFRSTNIILHDESVSFLIINRRRLNPYWCLSSEEVWKEIIDIRIDNCNDHFVIIFGGLFYSLISDTQFHQFFFRNMRIFTNYLILWSIQKICIKCLHEILDNIFLVEFGLIRMLFGVGDCLSWIIIIF